jgi:hypothetical protein
MYTHHHHHHQITKLSLSCTLRFFAASQTQRALSAPHFDNELQRSSLLQESG